MLKRYLVVLMMSAGLLSACGFHLRGNLPLSDTVKVIAVKVSDDGLRESMVDALRGSGASVVDEESARAVLDLFKITYDRKVRTIDTRGKVTGYTLEYFVRFRVVDAAGEVLRQTKLTVRRDFNFDPNAVLQAEDEERILREDMQDEIAQQILRQMATIAMNAPSPRMSRAA